MMVTLLMPLVSLMPFVSIPAGMPALFVFRGLPGHLVTFMRNYLMRDVSSYLSMACC